MEQPVQLLHGQLAVQLRFPRENIGYAPLSQISAVRQGSRFRQNLDDMGFGPPFIGKSPGFPAKLAFGIQGYKIRFRLIPGDKITLRHTGAFCQHRFPASLKTLSPLWFHTTMRRHSSLGGCFRMRRSAFLLPPLP